MAIKIIFILFFFSMIFLPTTSFGATPFFANDKFTQNGIEWCEENYALYTILQEEFFEHHKHSIESRVCVNLYDDPLWDYTEQDRYQKLIDQSAYYVELEIAESAQEAESGVIDVTPVEEPLEEIPYDSNTEEITSEEKSNPDNSDVLGEGDIERTIEQEAENGGGCLIATATYGTELSPQVQMLREIRDNSLMQTQSGSAFMNMFNNVYYSFSPVIADYERENPVFREAVKIAITPMIASLSVLNYVDADIEVEVLGYGISLIILNVGMYFAVPVISLMKIRKLF